jgi:hypothetical protein
VAEQFEDILNECIDRLLQGESMEACLRLYPEYAAELEPLLEVAVAAQRASSVEPRPEFKAQVTYQVRSSLRAGEQRREPKRVSLLGWLPRWATVAVAVVLVFLVAGSGTAAASSNSLPGDTLYSVKLATEHVQLFFTFSDAGKAKLYAKFAERRADEMARVADQFNPERIESLSDRLGSSLEKVKELAASIMRQEPDDGAQVDELRQQLQRSAAKGLETLGKLQGEAPDDSKSAFTDARGKLAQGYQSALDALNHGRGGRK